MGKNRNRKVVQGADGWSRAVGTANRVAVVSGGGAGAARAAEAANALKAGGLKGAAEDVGLLEERRARLTAERADEASAAGFYLAEGLDGSAVEARVEALDVQIAEIDGQLADLRAHHQADRGGGGGGGGGGHPDNASQSGRQLPI